MSDQVFADVSEFATLLRTLHDQRDGEVLLSRKERQRAKLTRAEREEVLEKTGGRCHICGGTIDHETAWQADHILACSTGGKHSVDNYLPAHSICNNYRWNYGAEEFQWILKLGVWMRTQIEEEKLIGREAGQKFCEYE